MSYDIAKAKRRKRRQDHDGKREWSNKDSERDHRRFRESKEGKESEGKKEEGGSCVLDPRVKKRRRSTLSGMASFSYFILFLNSDVK